MEGSIGGRIKEARKKAGLTQEELAIRLGIHSASLNRYEVGHRIPNAELILKIASELNCASDWLLSGHEKEKPLQMAEKPAIYQVPEDPELAEIIEWLKDNPEDKNLFLKLIKGRKFTKEALEGFGVKMLVEKG